LLVSCSEKSLHSKYNGKVSASQDSFMARKDKLQFQRLSKKYSEEELRNVFVANFIKGKQWSIEMVAEEAEDVYHDYLKRKQSLSYTFSNDLDRLFSENDPVKVFKPGAGIPPILNYLISERISPETFTILDRYTGFVRILDKKLVDDFLWQRYNTLSRKLHPFLEYDGDKMKNILKEKLHEYGFSREEQKESRKTRTEEAQIQRSTKDCQANLSYGQ
jgi:hypothetical protein